MDFNRTIGHILLVFLLLSSLPMAAQTGSEPTQEFIDAERRIVHNLANGLQRYDGVTVRYAFRMISEVGWSTPEDVITTVSAHFDHVISAELVPSEDGVLLFVETDGDLNNHEAYLQVLDLYGSSMTARPRSYNLK